MGMTRTLREWWQAWVAALGGANQLTMREAYGDAYEKPMSSPSPDTPKDVDDVRPRTVA